MQIDDGILVLPLPENHEDQGDRGDQGENHDEVGFEPIIALSLIEDNLQGAQTERHEAQTNVVDFSFAELASFKKGWILNEPRGQQNRNDPDRNIDEKNPAPGEVVGDPSAERRPNRRCGDYSNAINRESHAPLLRFKSIGEDGLFAGLQPGSAGALQHAANDENCQVR